ncbi:MAG: leucyl/phenylalanyl-tRNA--protein transferase [Betaproteobacteria bacterium]|nr:leucyl/phenylalanyl-tRNA--protein transferase [Betaproteobacteria bacterium]
MIPWLERNTPFPPVERALARPNGLLAAGADLRPARLLEAYRRGIFPWYSDGEPILWWSPDPRMVLFTGELKISRSLAKSVRNKGYKVHFDTDFSAVMDACAEPRDGQEGTWITDDMRSAYLRLHRLGHAHSVETWHDGKLQGGLYGIAIGRMFFGESMFARATDASKVALVALVREIHDRGFPLIDCQMVTRHLASLGARAIPRAEFLRRIEALVNFGLRPGSWKGFRQNADVTS